MRIGLLETTIVKHVAQCLRNIESGEREGHVPLLVVGSPGIGKTDIMKGARKALAKLLDRQIRVIMSHPTVKADVDYGGHPAIVDGMAEHLPYGDLRQLCEADELTICFLDDLGQSKASVQAALMQVVRERTINGHKISDNVHFVMATNGANDKAAVTGILRPLGNRCVACTVEIDVPYFADWLAKNHSDVPVMEAFIRHRPGHLQGEFLDADQIAGRIGAGFPTPRSVTMACDILRAGHDLEVIEALLIGTIGKPMASELIGYAKVYKTVTKYSQVVSDPMNAKLPKGIDARYAQCSALAQRAKRADMDAIARFIGRIGGDYASYFWGLIENTRRDLLETKAYQEHRMAQTY